VFGLGQKPTLSPSVLGVYPLEEPVLATGFPFRIWIATKGISVEKLLIVWPRCITLQLLPAMAKDRLAAAAVSSTALDTTATF